MDQKDELIKESQFRGSFDPLRPLQGLLWQGPGIT